MEIIYTYKAWDGQIFESEKECLHHELVIASQDAEKYLTVYDKDLNKIDEKDLIKRADSFYVIIPKDTKGIEVLTRIFDETGWCYLENAIERLQFHEMDKLVIDPADENEWITFSELQDITNKYSDILNLI